VPGLDCLGKGLILIGGSIVLLGLLMLGIGRLAGGGRLLPGDIVVSRPGFTFVFPVVTSLVVSAVLTAILRLIFGWRR